MRTFLKWFKYKLSIGFWRNVFFGHVKVRVYLKSGNHVDLIVENWKTESKGGEIHTGTADGIWHRFGLDPGQIEAWRAR
jgi:hypothetical protein